MSRCTQAPVRAARARYAVGRVGAGLVATVAFVAVSGCAQPGSGEQPPVPNWNNPIHGQVEASLAAAQVHIPFHIRSLPGFARAGRILDTPDLRPRDRLIVMQYRTSAGKVIANWVATNGQPGTSGSSTAVMVRGKYPALVTTASDGSRSDIRWIEAGIEYLITGPSLTKRACIHFADELAS